MQFIPSAGAGVDLSGYVPYTGATDDVDLGLFSIYPNSLYLPKTVDNTTGILWKRNALNTAYQPILHDFGTQNFFLGRNCGNFTMEGMYNLGFGGEMMGGITIGSENLCFGYAAGGSLTEGSGNLFIGTSSGGSINIGNYNIMIGNTGSALIGNESYLMYLGDSFGTPYIYANANTATVGFPLGYTMFGGYEMTQGATVEINGSGTGTAMAITCNGSDYMLLYNDLFGANFYYPSSRAFTSANNYMYMDSTGFSFGSQSSGIQAADAMITLHDGDMNFNTYKAIAMACDNGATLPVSASLGQWFLHTPVGRTILMQYNGTSRIPIISFGSITMYVDGTLGVDSQNNGRGTGANAFAKIMTAINLVPPLNQGAVTINIAAGTYSVSGSADSLVVAGKSFSGYYEFIIQGPAIDANTALISDTCTFTAGGASTAPSPAIITKTGAFTSYGTNGLRGYFVQYNGTGAFYVINENTNDTITIAENVVTGSVTSFKVYPPPTAIVQSTGPTALDYSLSTAFGQGSGTTTGVWFKNIKFDVASNAPTIGMGYGSVSTLLNCHVMSANRQNGAQIGGRCIINNSYVYQPYASRYALNAQAGSNLTLSSSLIYINADGCQGIRIAVGAAFNSQSIGCIYGNAGTTSNGLSIVGGLVTLFNQYFKNLNIGVSGDVSTVLVYQNKSYATFSGCTTDFSKSVGTYNGGLTLNYRPVTTTYQVLSNDYTVDATTGTFTITLESAVPTSNFPGILHVIKNSGAGTITVAGWGGSIGGSSTTRFDITNPSGTTFRYTFDGTGTNPNIFANTIPVGTWLDIQGQNFNAANKLIAQVTASGTNYFEITNAAGVAENDKTLGTGYINFNQRIDGSTTYSLAAGAAVRLQSTGVNRIVI